MTAPPAPALPMQPAALAGVTVLDLSTRLPGPLATLMLAQAGARVIKVERPPEGDELRAFAPRLDGMSAHFAWLNRGKESVALDLKDADGRARFEELLAGADVLVEQFRPGVMARLGLGWEDLAPRHPGLIYCAITGFGRDDARSLTAAHDLNYQAAAGLVGSATRDAEGLPVLPPVLLGDIAGGSFPAVTSILLALMQRQATGRGQFLDIAMSRNVEVFSLWNRIQGALTGTWPSPGEGRHTGGSPRYRVYAARDGRFLAVAALEDRFWQAFQQAIGLEIAPEWESSAPKAVIAAVAARLAERDAADWLAAFEGRDCCCCLAPDLEGAVSIGAQGQGGGQDGGPGPSPSRLPHIPLPLAPQFTTGRRDPAPPPLGGWDRMPSRTGESFPGHDRWYKDAKAGQGREQP